MIPTASLALRGGVLLVAAALAAPAFAQSDDDAPSESPLVRRLKSGNVPAERLATFIDQIGKRGSAADLDYLFTRALAPDGFPPAARAKVFDVLAEAAFTRKVKPSGDLARLSTLIDSDAPLRLDALKLAGLWKVEGLRTALGSIAAGKPPRPLVVRKAAIDALAEIGGDASIAALKPLTRAPETYFIRASAVGALATLDLAAAAAAAPAAMAEASSDRDLEPLITPFLSLKGGPDALAAAIQKAGLSADAAKLALRTLYSLGRTDPKLVATLSKLAKLDAVVKPLTKAEVDALIAEVNSRGDAVHGEEVFRRADLSCMKCHAVAGAAGGVGPELSAVGMSSPVDYLINSILAPDQAIKEEFVTKIVETADGRTYQGILVDKDDKRLILREATGDLRTIPASDVDTVKDGGSLMPKGLVNFMTHREFVDLLKFLSLLGKPGAYAIHTVPTVQRWRVLKLPAAELPAGAPDLETLRTKILGADSTKWAPAYANVPGFVYLSDFAQPVVYLQAEIDVTAAGSATIAMNSQRGVDAWIDDAPIPVAQQTTVDLAVGRHKLTLRVDTTARGTLPLKVEILKPAGSGGQFTVVGGR